MMVMERSEFVKDRIACLQISVVYKKAQRAWHNIPWSFVACFSASRLSQYEIPTWINFQTGVYISRYDLTRRYLISS